MSSQTVPDPLAPARAKLDAKIAEAARTLLNAVEAENTARGGNTRLVVGTAELADLRAQVAAWEAFGETLGDGS